MFSHTAYSLILSTLLYFPFLIKTNSTLPHLVESKCVQPCYALSFHFLFLWIYADVQFNVSITFGNPWLECFHIKSILIVILEEQEWMAQIIHFPKISLYFHLCPAHFTRLHSVNVDSCCHFWHYRLTY